MEANGLVPAHSSWSKTCLPRPSPSAQRNVRFFGVLPVVALLVYLWVSSHMAPLPGVTDSYTDEADCLWVLSSMIGLNHFPLPHPINREEHEGILKELGRPDLFRHLVDARSNVRATLTTTVEKLVGFVSTGAQRYSQCPSKDVVISFHSDIDHIRRQLEVALSGVTELADLYDIVKEGYYTLDATASTAFGQGQLSTPKKFWVYQRPWHVPWYSFDANKAYLDPLNEKAKKKEEASRGLIAWERETQRLYQISSVLRGFHRGIQHFANALPQRDTGINDYGNSPNSSRARTHLQQWTDAITPSILHVVPGFKRPKPRGTRDSGQGWLREWYRQHIVDDRQLKEEWTKLLTSVDHQEEKLRIEIRSEWCGRVETQ